MKCDAISLADPDARSGGSKFRFCLDEAEYFYTLEQPFGCRLFCRCKEHQRDEPDLKPVSRDEAVVWSVMST